MTRHRPAATDTTAAQPQRHRRFGRRNRYDPTDSVVIDDEAQHAWWARRDDLSESAAPPRRDRGGQRAAEASAAAFAPAPDATTQPSGPRETWDLDSLYEWGATTAPAAPEPDPEQASPWTILGLSPDAHWLEVVRRHRELAKRYHPDLHSDADLATRREAETMMASINVAFDELMRLYGMEKGA